MQGPMLFLLVAFSIGPRVRARCVRADGALRCQQEHVAGGSEVADADRRPTVALLVSESPSGRSVCTATLVHPRFLLSAAHCVLTGRLTGVFAGTRDGMDTVKNAKHHNDTQGRYHNIPYETITTHPHYKTNENYNDLSIIKLAEDMAGEPVKLYAGAELPTDTIKIIGYGMHRDENLTAVMDGKLRAAEVPLLPADACNISVKCLERSCICAGATNKGSLPGDSGGPAYIELDGKFYQVGITSYGRALGELKHSDAYMRVSFYCDFIREKTGGAVVCEEPPK